MMHHQTWSVRSKMLSWPAFSEAHWGLYSKCLYLFLNFCCIMPFLKAGFFIILLSPLNIDFVDIIFLFSFVGPTIQVFHIEFLLASFVGPTYSVNHNCWSYSHPFCWSYNFLLPKLLELLSSLFLVLQFLVYPALRENQISCWFTLHLWVSENPL